MFEKNMGSYKILNQKIMQKTITERKQLTLAKAQYQSQKNTPQFQAEREKLMQQILTYTPNWSSVIFKWN